MSIRKSAFGAVLMAASMGLPAWAQDAADGDPLLELSRMTLEQLSNVEVTSVSKAAQSLSSAPASIYVITREELLRSGVTSVPEAVSSMSVLRASMNENLPVASTSVVVQGDPAGTVSVEVPYPQGFGTRSEIAVLMSRPDAQMAQRHEVHTASLGTSATVDLGKQQLPWLTSLAATRAGVTWALVAPGDPPDGMLTSWSGSWSDGARPVSVSWAVAQPAELAAALT